MRKSKRPLLWVYGGASLIIMVIIFLFSSQPGDESGTLSTKVLKAVKDNGISVLTPNIKIDKKAKTGGSASDSAKTDSADSDVNKSFDLSGRKWGHVYLYALLGVIAALLFLELFGHGQSKLKRFVLSPAAAAAFCFLYGCGDELHQKFVEDRTGQLSDVRYDAVGFGAAILLVLAIDIAAHFVWKRVKK